jgi:hypothetical protein
MATCGVFYFAEQRERRVLCGIVLQASDEINVNY